MVFSEIGREKISSSLAEIWPLLNSLSDWKVAETGLRANFNFDLPRVDLQELG